MIKTILIILSVSFFSSCGQKSAGKSVSNEVEVKQSVTSTPAFDADSAYTYIAEQVAFGPRVPNTQAHKNCGDYLLSELKRHGAELFVQDILLTAYDNTQLEARNIIGVFNPESKKRILLFAHWDTRPYADEDPDPANHHTPIDGADDGASGVGVLLEIARQLGMNKPEIGVDIIFFDAEDYGEPAFAKTNKMHTWCLGSQFWAKNPHVKNYRADFGILLDMVGSKDAAFFKEGQSVYHAAPLVEKIWGTARDLGYGKYFLNANGGSITDDHIYVINGRKIPCVDIINLEPEGDTGFGAYWHTLNDTMDNIDRETLHAVGHTVLEVIYKK
ncbi:glutamine cyclotransferase [Parabacteroides sp. 52]|uniref:M20 family metallopeptidase n=1 Tax=Parabacteroides sp. 52 TaxID=2302940 RepID=UPI0013CFA4CD|nr:M28 family peptidase [Parabacteroides sp. 52]NDV55620.1 glutamine cyclotransferase [Parabacteroides sp. 52]